LIKLPLDPKESKKRQRERWLILGFAILFLVLTITEIRLSKQSTSLPFVNSIFFFGLLNVNIVIFGALLWLIFKNVGKLFFERRSRILGASLKTKLVVAFIGFSAIPTVVLFIISSLYINSSFDKWFSLKVQNTLQSSLDIARQYYVTAEASSSHFARLLGNRVGKQFPNLKSPAVARELARLQDEMNLDGVELYTGPLDPVLAFEHNLIRTQYPGALVRLTLERLETAFQGKAFTYTQSLGTTDLVRSTAPIRDKSNPSGVVGVIVVSSVIPVNLSARADEISHVVKDYKETNPLRYPIKTTYTVILVLITVLIIFAEIWLGLYLARELTVPIERLVRAADEVGRGRLNFKIEKSGHDEIAVLVDAFNRMLGQLGDAQTSLEQRSAQMEAVLTQIDAGVLQVDAAGHLVTVNAAASRILGFETPNDKPQFKEALTGPTLQPLAEVLENALKGGRPEELISSWTPKVDDQVKNLVASATPLSEGGTIWGAVAVIDDLTQVVKGQREMAWREVARRIAHEIKNPLTPIKLSAQRLQRKLQGLPGKEGELLQECTATIISQTDELKELVNEFSNFARLPELNASPNSIPPVLEEVAQLFRTAHPDVFFHLKFDPALRPFTFDRDQIKRAITNLVNNSIAAMRSSPKSRVPEIFLEGALDEDQTRVKITVKDNGPGMNAEIQERAFEPYFSTKSEGTGLGLAIVKKIVNDHGGYIKLTSREGVGTTFVIELPIPAKNA
jgi:two-component system, NtrC family, nitrogen regulation sensor histidine kinase NtrY